MESGLQLSYIQAERHHRFPSRSEWQMARKQVVQLLDVCVRAS